MLRTPEPGKPNILNYIHSVIAIPLIYLYTIIMASLSLTFSLLDKSGRKQHWCARVWCKLIANTALAPVHVHGVENIEKTRSYVFLSTHQSYMDIPAMLGYLPVQLRIAAKKSLFKIPFMGWHLWRAGHIPIDRSSTEKAIESMKRAEDKIRDGICAFVFPEGTRSHTGALQNFKKGGFKLAIHTGVPIVPITIIGSRQVLPRDSIVFRAGQIDMYIDPPIETKGLTNDDIPMLMDKVRWAMLKHFPNDS
jgi:1-acyl-sn-glycerol-3-phosphate acyltransferase